MQAGHRLDVGQPGSERLDAGSGESTAGQSQVSQPFSAVTEAPRPAEGGEQANQGCGKDTQAKPQPTPCPRCQSPNTKFAYWNNYNHQQPRFFCKACQRYWTAGGTLRNVPIGAGRRKNSRSAARSAPDHHSKPAGGPLVAAQSAPAVPVAAPSRVPSATAPLLPDAALLSVFGAPVPKPAMLAQPGLRTAGGAAQTPANEPALEGGRRVRARLEPPGTELGDATRPDAGEAAAVAGSVLGFSEWASMAAAQQLQQHAALQAAAFGQAHAQLMAGGGWGGPGGNPYLPALWPYNMYGGAPGWAAAYASLGVQAWGSLELSGSTANTSGLCDLGGMAAQGSGMLQAPGGAPPAFAWHGALPGGLPSPWPAWATQAQPAHAQMHAGKGGAGGGAHAAGSSMLSGGSGGSGASALTAGALQLHGSRRPSHSMDTAG